MRESEIIVGSEDSGYSIWLGNDAATFSSAHFITYEGHRCESLHGHNYRTRLGIEGPLDENYYVLDFSQTKKTIARCIDQLDHAVLLPTRNPLVEVMPSADEIEARYKSKRYVFPREDVVLIPIENTTAELLAKVLATLLVKAIGGLSRDQRVIVEVEESRGQLARFVSRVKALSPDDAILSGRNESRPGKLA